MIRVTVNNQTAKLMQQLSSLQNPDAFNPPVEKAAWRVRTGLIEATPRRYTGMTKRSWKIEKIEGGGYAVRNESKVMRFLESGTGNSTGGWIYPKRSKVLFVPLNKSAAFGWKKSLVPGRDYILARRVRGIQARNIVSRYSPIANAILKEEIITFLRKKLDK